MLQTIIIAYLTGMMKIFMGVWMKLFTFEYLLELELSKIYRYVNREEFYKKLKEKYDATCLNIVLKRLVNDDFRW